MKGSLECLKLDFTEIERPTDEEILGFLKHLSNLELLKTLHLKEAGKPLTDYFLKNLSFRLSFLLDLSDLQLNFLRTEQITNEGLRNLSKGLSMTKKLVHLDLYFDLLPEVSNSSIQAFCYGLKTLGNIKSLNLYFAEF